MITVIVSGVLGFLLAFFVAPAGSGFYLSLAFITWLFWAFLALGIEGKRDQSHLRWLGEKLPLPYDWVMDRVLVGLPNLLLPKAVSENPCPSSGAEEKLDWYLMPHAKDPTDKISLSKNPWSWPVFDAAMKIALLYPLFFAMIQWALNGAETGIGEILILPGIANPYIRWISLLIVTSLIATIIMSAFLIKNEYEVYSKYALNISSGLAFLITMISGLNTQSPLLSIVSASIAAAVAIQLIATYSGAMLLSITIVFALGGHFAIAFHPEVTWVIGNLLDLWIYACVGGVMALFVATVFWCTRMAIGLRAYFALILFSVISSIAAEVVVYNENSISTSWILAFVLLPTINSIFDWLSYGFTIWLLRRGHRKRGVWPWIFGACDAAVALVLFFVLSLTLCSVIAIINNFRVEPLIDLGILLAGVKHNPSDYYWVIAMIGSTLLPTLIHIGIAILHGVTIFPDKLWHWFVDKMSDGDARQLPLIASMLMTICLAAYALILVAPFYLVGWVIWSFGEPLRIWYVDTIVYLMVALGML